MVKFSEGCPLFPLWKIEVDSDTWASNQSLSVVVNRPENAVSSAVLVANDYKGIAYLSKLNNLDTFKVSFRYKEWPGHAETSWIKVLEGEAESLQPQISNRGEVLGVTCRGAGWPLVDMRVFQEYGVESKNPTIDKISEIIGDIVTNYVNKSFGGAASGHALTTLIDSTPPAWDASLAYTPFPFKTSLDALKILCDLGTAYAGPTNAGPHFFVTPAGKLCVATIGNHVAAFNTDWPTWWQTDQAGSTLTLGDYLNYNFQDDVKNYFNHIIYAGNLLKPGKGDYAENNSADWDVAHTGGNPSVSNDNAIYKVGSYSIKANDTAGVLGSSLYVRYKKDTSWGYNLHNWGGEIAHPTINFWLRRDAGIRPDFYMRVNQAAATYAGCRKLTLPNVNEWYGFSLEIGPYGHISDSDGNDWLISGGFDWTTTNWVYFFGVVDSVPCNYWIDGLNFQGQIIRAAKDTTKIGNHTERQNYFFDSVGKDDTGKSGTPGTTDTGYMARICKAELLRSAKQPLIGNFTIPLAPDLLPGQLVHCHAVKTNGTSRIDEDFRAVNVTHTFTAQGALTQVSVTNDLKNSMVNKTFSMANMIVNQILGKDKESLNLKSMNIDLTTPMLSETYAT